MNVPAHHGIHFRITQQDRTQHMRVAQAVLIEPCTAGRQRMMVQQQQRIALGVSLQAALHPLELVFAQFAVRYAEHRCPTSAPASYRPAAPVWKAQCQRRPTRRPSPVENRGYPAATRRGRQLRDAGGEVAVRLLRMILRQISRGDDQVDIAALRTDGVQHRVIAAIGIDAEQRLVFAGKRWVSVICRILTAAPLATGSLNRLSKWCPLLFQSV